MDQQSLFVIACLLDVRDIFKIPAMIRTWSMQKVKHMLQQM